MLRFTRASCGRYIATTPVRAPTTNEDHDGQRCRKENLRCTDALDDETGGHPAAARAEQAPTVTRDVHQPATHE